MHLGYIIVAAIAASATVFALQNTDHTAVRFVFWRLEGVSIATLTLGSLAAGLLIMGLPLWIKLKFWRARARSLEARVTMLEGAVEERDRQLLGGPGGGGDERHAGRPR